MKIGITGSSGNIGDTLVNGLSNKYDLKLFDKNENKKHNGFEFIKIDFSEKEKLKNIFDNIDIILHIAGDPNPNSPVSSTIKNNFLSLSNIFDEAYQSGVKKIVFASSNFYHQGDIVKYLRHEKNTKIYLDDFPSPLCKYAESKVFGENLGLHFSYFGLKFAALRIGWTIPEDDPSLYSGAYMRSMFCSKRDLVQAFEKAILCDKNFVTAFAISNNKEKIFDLDKTKENIGFIPLDDSSLY